MDAEIPASRGTLWLGVLEPFEELSASGRDLTRWSARLLAATLLLSGLDLADKRAANIFDDLANQLRETAACSSKAPLWLSIVGLLLGYVLLRGALWSAVGIGVFGVRKTPFATPRQAQQDLRPLRNEIALALSTPSSRRLRWGLLSRVWVLAVASGVASVAFVAWVLRHLSASLLVWALIVAMSMVITNIECRVRIRRFAPSRVPPPSPQEARRRLATYIAKHPSEADSAAPLAYAYSRLDRSEIFERFAELGRNGPGRASTIGTVVLVAAIFPHLPVPGVQTYGRDGFVGCVYANAFGFFRLAEANLLVSIGAAVLVTVAVPVLVLHAWHRFLAEWHAPIGVRVKALWRERLWAARMTPHVVVSAFMWSVVAMAALWISAEVATGLDSAFAGLGALAVIDLALIAVVRSAARRISASL